MSSVRPNTVTSDVVGTPDVQGMVQPRTPRLDVRFLLAVLYRLVVPPRLGPPDLKPPGLPLADLNPPDLGPDDFTPPRLGPPDLPPDLKPPGLNPPGLGPPDLKPPGFHLPWPDFRAAPSSRPPSEEPLPFGFFH